MTPATLDPYFEPFRAFSERSIADLDAWQEQGGKIAGIYCIYAPGELIRAAGVVPVSLCGKKQDPIKDAERDLPASFCPLIKSSYGYAVTDTCPFFSFSDFLVAEITCDGKKKMYELLGEIKPLHLMHLPHTQTGPAALAYWIAAFKELEVCLTKASGRSVTPEGLWAQIKQQNQIRQTLVEVALLAADPRIPVGAGDMLAVQESKSFCVYPEKYLQQLTRLKSGLKDFLAQSEVSRSEASRPDVPPKQPARVLLTGCPTGKGSDKVIKIIEELGARVVCMENCSGLKGMGLAVDETGEPGDPYEALARRYLQIPCSCMSPNPNRLSDLRQMAGEFKADAVVDLTWLGCHTYNAESLHIQNLVEQELELPFLHIETDYSESDIEQLKTRIEALIELTD